jgi:hypothetical protein
VALIVLRGRNPWIQVRPPFTEVAKPMLADTPLNTRPTWNADTIVWPEANEDGSTSVLWALKVLAYGSVLSSLSDAGSARPPWPRQGHRGQQRHPSNRRAKQWDSFPCRDWPD